MALKTDLFPGTGMEQLYGFYRGVVIDNRDPDIEEKGLTYGRVKVFIPSLMKDQETGIWAYPANNCVGGRNDENISEKVDHNGGRMMYAGSFYVPPSGSFVIIFFENGDPNRPYYLGGLDIRAHEAPPEISVGIDQKPEERWLVFHSPQGRAIMISDDADNCRIEITGKKRAAPDNTSSYVYDIDGNQKTILIDDRDGKEKILIKDQNGNYININTSSGNIDIHANNNIRLNAGGNVMISAGGNINMKGSAIKSSCDDFSVTAGGLFAASAGDCSLTGDCKLSPSVHLCEGSTSPSGVDGGFETSGERGSSSGAHNTTPKSVPQTKPENDAKKTSENVKKEEAKKKDPEKIEKIDEKPQKKDPVITGSGAIIIDAGHGKPDGGASNVISGNPSESVYNLNVARELRNILQSYGAEVVMTRDDDNDLCYDESLRGKKRQNKDLNTRVSIANSSKAGLFVSIHHNASNPTGSGCAIYYSSGDPTGKTIASKMSQKVASVLGVINKGAKTGGYRVLRGTKMPSVLTEQLFMSNTSEMNIAAQSEYVHKVAQAIADIIKEEYLDKQNSGNGNDDSSGSD